MFAVFSRGDTVHGESVSLTLARTIGFHPSKREIFVISKKVLCDRLDGSSWRMARSFRQHFLIFPRSGCTCCRLPLLDCDSLHTTKEKCFGTVHVARVIACLSLGDFVQKTYIRDLAIKYSGEKYYRYSLLFIRSLVFVSFSHGCV